MYSWICGFLLKHGRFIRAYTFKENQLSISKKLSITSRSLTGGRTLCWSPFLMLVFVMSWTFTDLVYALMTFMNLCLYFNAMSGRHLLLPTTTDSYNLFASSAIISEPCEEWIEVNVPFMVEHFSFSYPLYIYQLWVSLLIDICLK